MLGPVVIVVSGLALAMPAAHSEQPAVRTLPAREVFPGGDGASAATLDTPLPALVQSWQETTKKRAFRKKIIVHKARRRLDVFADETLLKSYIVNLGLAPEGDKNRQGDMRTPEGDLFICSMSRVSRFTRFLNLAYPTPRSARAGVESGRVNARVEEDVLGAFRQRNRCPPQNTPLGGAVGIHGSGGWESRPGGYVVTDWTWGCVGLRDSDILELFDGYAEVGLQVQIEAD